ncbi:retinoblastoma-binding protein [Niveomyces insectorum RCEF 264]|uniref:Retinoblastoma-binding protein n=1 Tax=Niveomyces insectorum RCEF 264 TaxID=1081102 RepID=A0A168A9Z5_9HYPO|nr:retinoblastoma-binding protein [Niveomyces insectorum RCEF 264]
MSSSVYFKFKSQKEPTRVEFDGTGISVFELKRDIILKSGLGDGTDFDLAIYTEDEKEEYDDDTTIIPRSTTVIARRIPPMKTGAGRAARYVSGKMPVNARNASRREQAAKATAKGASSAIEQMNNAMTEEEKLAAMFAAQSEQWNAQQEEMSHQTPIFKPGSRRPANVPDHDPPNGYICYRCGEKGHWIQLCPTNDNPEFDNRPRVKRTTGIPRSFLKTVDKAAMLAQAAEDDTKAPSGIMVNADGEFVIAEPDKASWEKFQAKTKSGAAAQEVAALADKELQDRGLECPIDKKLFIDPMKTPCCGKTYCNDCITNALIESDFVCPGCQSEGVLIDDLKPDDETEQKIRIFQDEKEANQKKAAEAGNKDDAPEAVAKSPVQSPAVSNPKRPDVAAETGNESPAPQAATAQTTAGAAAETKTTTTLATSKAPSGSPAPANPRGPQSPSSVKSPAEASQKSAPDGGFNAELSQANTKKRPAETDAENPKIPKAPKAMQQQQQQQQQSLQAVGGVNNEVNGFGMNGMGGMNGLGMPGMNGMNGMNGYGGMNVANMGTMGGMGMMPYGSMPMMNYGMGMGNMGNMGHMGNMGGMGSMNNPAMMNPMMGMNGTGGGYAAGGYGTNGANYQQGWGTMNGNGGGYGSGGGGYNQQQQFGGFHGPNTNGNQNQHHSQNFYNNRAMGNGSGNDNEDDAYFRKPVNPNRHFNKPKRVRPSDYREL